MTFAQPGWLLLLLALPVLAWLKGRSGAAPAFLYSSVQLVGGLARARRSRAGALLAAMRWGALALFIVALAQPRLVKSETQVRASGVDIVVALDLSGSMAAEDFRLRGEQINRLAMAKEVLRQFIQRRPNDRIGLVVFAAQPFVVAPPTLDHDFLEQNLARLNIGTIGAHQTAIGSGLATALNRLRELPSKSRIVILMTDGVNNAGQIDPLEAADAAAALGVKVYTIGVGTRGLAPVPQQVFGQKIYQMQPVDIDEKTLQEIARRTGGKYYRADSAETFQTIYAAIDRLEKTEATMTKFVQFRELFAWVLVPGLALLLLEVTLAHTAWRRLP